MKPHLTRIGVTLTLVAVVVLLGVAVALGHNPLGSIDTGILEWMVDHRTSGATSAATTATDLFAPLWTGVWTVLAAAILAAVDRTLIRGVTLLGTVAIAGAACEVLKLGIDRLRPPEFDQVTSPELAMSFPSGHVTGATALLIGLAVIATTTARSRTRWWVVSIAALAATLIALTRLYLGAHWFSDVAAAIALAIASVVAVPTLVTVGLGCRDADRIAELLPPGRGRPFRDDAIQIVGSAGSGGHRPKPGIVDEVGAVDGGGDGRIRSCFESSGALDSGRDRSHPS